MSKTRSVLIGETTLSVGDKLGISESGEYDGHGKMGETVTVHHIKQDGGILIGLVSERKNGNWSNMDGRVKSGHGLYFRKGDILRYFTFMYNERMVVDESFKFRTTDLEGMECNILAGLPDGKSVFIELDKDIGGCGCDGLGKAGHCLAVPHKILKVVKRSKKRT